MIIMLINWCIPDTPKSVKINMIKEKRFLDEILIKREQKEQRGSDNSSFYETLEKTTSREMKNVVTNSKTEETSNRISDVEEIPVFDEVNEFPEFKEIKPPTPPEMKKSEPGFVEIQLDEISYQNPLSLRDVLYRNTEGVFPDDIRNTIRESNLNDLTETLNEISDLVEDLNVASTDL